MLRPLAAKISPVPAPSLIDYQWYSRAVIRGKIVLVLSNDPGWHKSTLLHTVAIPFCLKCHCLRDDVIDAVIVVMFASRDSRDGALTMIIRWQSNGFEILSGFIKISEMFRRPSTKSCRKMTKWRQSYISLSFLLHNCNKHCDVYIKAQSLKKRRENKESNLERWAIENYWDAICWKRENRRLYAFPVSLRKTMGINGTPIYTHTHTPTHTYTHVTATRVSINVLFRCIRVCNNLIYQTVTVDYMPRRNTRKPSCRITARSLLIFPSN